MPLFIQDAPFFEGEASDPDGQKFLYTEVRLPMAVTEPVASNPPQDSNVDFVLDTGADIATVSQGHLDDAQFPVLGPSGGRIWVTWANGNETRERTRDATLWLYSNMKNKLPQYKIELNGGVVVSNAPKSKIQPLLGLNALIEAGLRIELDAERQLVSVWIPD